MKTPLSTRRAFLQATGTALLGGVGRGNDGVVSPQGFSFILLGDLHYDKLEHHDMAWLKEHKAGDLGQIQNYSRITSEVTPQLFATVRETIRDLKSGACPPAMIVQVGDWVEGLCGREDLAVRQNQEAVEFVQSANFEVPFVFTKGNHDVTGPGAESAFAEVFHPFLTTQSSRIAGHVEELKGACYTLRHGEAVFCFFDAYDDASLAWLEATLARRTERHCFVVIHPPVVPYGARSTWHLFSHEEQKVQREKLLHLLGQHEACVLGGHIHKFNSMLRTTSKAGRFTQVALSSVISQTQVPTPKNLLSGVDQYTGDQVLMEPRHSPETEKERRAVYDLERPWVKSFTYADLPGYAVITVNDSEIKAEMYAGTSRQLWRTVNMVG